MMYVDQTRQKVQTRILQHCSRIQCKVQGAPLVEHFTDKQHPADSLKWWVLQKILPNPWGGDLLSILNLRECKWIHLLASVNKGLNELEEISRQVSLLCTG